MKPIGIIGAMASEIELLKAEMSDMKVEKTAAFTFYCGKLNGTPVVVQMCGIGKVCAAMGTQAMIDRYDVSAIINTGVAGGLAKGLAIGDLVVSTDVVQHDYDLTPFGYVRGYLSGVGTNGQEVTRIPADKALRDAFAKAADKVLTDAKWVEGTIASGDIFVSNNELKQTLIAQFNASAAEMEGAAIGEVAYLNQVPFLVIRALSDLADSDAFVSFDEFEKAAAKRSAAIVIEMTRQ